MSIEKRLVSFCVVAAALLAYVPNAPAQTDLSLRIRSLSPRFGGVVPDLVTDAFLNPARLSAFSGTQLYIAKNPQRSYLIPFPAPFVRRFTAELLPPEGFGVSGPWSYSSAPYEITMFTGLGASTRGAFSLAVFADTRETLNEGADVTAGFRNGSIYFEDSASASRDERTSFRLEGALSTGDSPEDRSLGLRAVVARYSSNAGSVRSTDRTRIYPVNEVTTAYDFERSTGEFLQLDAVATGGLYRPGAMLREVMVAAGYSQREWQTDGVATQADDNDADGNGVGFNGPPERSFSQAKFLGDRVYDGPVLRARAHVDFTDHVAFVAGGYLVYRTGSGDGAYTRETQTTTTTTQDVSSVRIPYSYDGSDQQYGLSTVLGYHREIAKGVLMSLGGTVSFSSEKFSEDGAGTMRIDASGSNSVSVEAAYTQKTWRVRDVLQVAVPAGVEWTPIDVLALRLGLEVAGVRDEDTRVVRRRPDASALPPEYQRVSETRSYDLRHDVFFRMSTGIGVSLAERLYIDLLFIGQSIFSDAVSFASFNYLSLRYRF